MLQGMVESIKRGVFGAFIPFDRQGAAVLLSPRPSSAHERPSET